MSYTQRETPVLAELCTLLVQDVYGELAARVYSVLARHGRQTLAALARASYLSGRQIKYGLVILLQQHLVFYSPSDAPVTHYEIDWQNSYALVRLGKVSKMVEDRFGKKAANVVSNLLTLGHTRIADLKEAYFPSPAAADDGDSDDDDVVNGAGLKRKRANEPKLNGTAPKVNGKVNGQTNGIPAELEDSKSSDDLMNSGGPVNGVNGTIKQAGKIDSHQGSTHSENENDDDIDAVEEFYDLVRLLAQKGWICTVTDSHYISPGDTHTMMRQEAMSRATGGAAPSGPKQKKEVLAITRTLMREVRDECFLPPNISHKRKSEDSHYVGPTKRIKMIGEQSQTVNHTNSPEDDFVIRVNPEKIAVAMRTEYLVQLVQQRLGPTTAKVYETMLRILEANTSRCFDEWSDLAEGAVPEVESYMLVTARDVAAKLSRDFDICEGLDPNAVVAVTQRGRVQSTNILSNPVDPTKLKMDEKTQLVDKHIRLLAEDPLHFATWHTRAGFSQWHVEFGAIAKQLIQSEIENTVSARKGALAVKLIRALRKKGKLDERATCNAMMMSANDIRGIITDLTVQGFVQTQEIPKVERREAKHSMHLIWYDRQRAREKLLHDTYKGMIRILQRISYEREKVQPLLSKAERSDVIGNEDKWLSKGELDVLRKWKEVQEKLLLQLFREDDLVATLRDFCGPLVTS